MKSPLISLALLFLALSSACSSSKKSDSTPAPAVTATAVARATVVPTAGPIARAKLAPDNVAGLQIETQGTLSSLEGLVWRDDSLQLLAYSRQAISVLENGRSGQFKQLTSVTPPEEILDVAAAGTGSFVTRLDPTTFNLRSLPAGAVVKSVNAGTQFSNVVLSRDGRMAAVERQDKIAVDLYQLPAGTLVKQLSGFETAAPVYSVRFSSDARSLIWLARAQLQVQDIVTGAFAPPLSHEDFVSGVAQRPGANTLATGSGKSVFIWDTDGGSPLQTLEQEGIVSGVAYSADGSLMAVATDAGVTFWDAREPMTYKKSGVLAGSFKQVSFAPSGTAIATARQDGQAAIWTTQGPSK